MWLQTLLCISVGVAYAIQNPGWQEGKEYVYQVRSRTLTSLNENTNNYTGIFLKATLSLKPVADGKIYGKILDPQYASFHKSLYEGWDADVSDSDLNYKNFENTLSKPFQIELTNGVIRNLYVSKDMTNWEANIIKSIVSQFQLDTNADKLIPSYITSLPELGSNNAVFKTMEETVTGICETLYEIHPLPEVTLQARPWLVPLEHLIQEGELIEIQKTKNYTNSEVRPSYHFGFQGIEDYELRNKIGNFFSRSSENRAVVTGSLVSYTIQSSVTVDRITISPTLNEQERGSVNTIVNVTLESVKPQSGSNEDVPNPVEVSIVYAYNQPFSDDNGPRPEQEQVEEDSKLRLQNILFRRSSRNSDSSSSEEEKYMRSTVPQLEKAPESPLLPFTVGYDGQSIRKKQNIVENVRRLAKTIGAETTDNQKVLDEHTVEKFVTLSSLMRIMHYRDIEEAARQLYYKGDNEVSVATWEVFRDAVAQAGTGPALLAIRSFIQNGKIAGEEAAEIVCRAANSARQPSLEYMQQFYKMVEEDQVRSQAHLNESALLCFSSLVHDVYISKENSHNKYPVHSFGSFRTSEGKQWVEDQVIPTWSKTLQDAVTRADVQNIHTWIRVLGNVGHRHVLETFKPYLEGEKQVSQFQRLFMVVALDKLASANPRVARSVLYRIYQNSYEEEQVRVAAVAQLMRTNPSSEMLQRMAANTNVDSHEYVNAAIKSAIESASQLEGAEHAALRSAAEAAKPLLTSQEYGFQYSQEKLRSHVVEQIEMAYKQTVQSYGSVDHFWPKGIKYNLRARFGGFKQHVVNMKAMVSSIDDLFNVFEQQTKKYQEEKQKKKSHNGQEYELSSEYTARLLNMENEQREQLEAMLYYHIAHLQKISSLNNHTIQNISKVVRELEEELKIGKQYTLRRMSIQNEVAVSFPTELGLPFIYTYDKPTYVDIETNVKGQATPKISSGEYLQGPDSVTAEFDFCGSITGKTQSQFGFITPFDSQRYSAGYEKNFQVVVPVSGTIEADLVNQQLKMELVPYVADDINLLHYSTIPYTANNDIYTPKPLKNIIKSKRPYVVDTVIGHDATGIALNVNIHSDYIFDLPYVYDKLRQHDLVSAMLSPLSDDNIHHLEINVGINAQQSTTQKINIYMGHQNRFDAERMERSDSPIGKIDNIPDEPNNRKQRQNMFMDLSRQDIKDVHSHVFDVLVELTGKSKIRYTTTLAASRSNSYPKSRIVLHLKRQNKEGQTKNLYLVASGHFPNTNELNMKYAMEMDPTSNIDVEAGLGRTYEEAKKFTAHVMLSKSEQRKEYLMNQQAYKDCRRQMQEGNYQLPTCARMTAEANYLDQFELRVDYDDMEPLVINQTYQLYSILRHHLYPSIEEDINSRGEKQNQLYVKGQFQPDLHAFNFSMDSDFGKVQVKNYEVNDFFRHLLVPHPVYHVKSRMIEYFHKYYTYRPMCVIDKNAVSTFDNKTYSLELSKDWTVFLHYVPRRPSPDENPQSVPEQLQETIEGHIVWIRAYDKDPTKKEVKMIVQTPGTNAKIIDITLKPSDSSSGSPRFFINNEQVDYKKSSNFYDDFLQVYGLPNSEVKVEIKNSHYIVYDGIRMKLTVVDAKFRDASRGLCGTFTNEEETDFVSPRNCILNDTTELVQHYKVSGNQQIQEVADCYQKKVGYVSVVSAEDIGHGNYERKNHQRASCTKHQTRYVISRGESCFTLRPLPVCKSGCRPSGKVSKLMPVHCVSSASATMWKNQIDKGASPDFSMKTESRKIAMEIPIGCSP